jgi:hypothetical protein
MMSELSDAQILRAVAQNDYMIDSNYLPDGEELVRIAAVLDEAEMLIYSYEQRQEHLFVLHQTLGSIKNQTTCNWTRALAESVLEIYNGYDAEGG